MGTGGIQCCSFDSRVDLFGGVTLAARGSWPVARGEVEGVHHKLRATGYKPSFL